ncbi:MAG: band 7 protein [uncultured bacterium]|nr:MAG: band 7 protein [uncultured bacterium]
MQTLDPTRLRRYIKSGGVVFFIFLVLLIFAISCWTIVSTGHTGVQALFGKVQDQELSSGFHIKNPFVHVTEMSVRTEDYTMSVTQGEGEKVGPDAILALTKEGLQVDLDITVLYHLQEEKASDMYRDVGLDYDNVVIRPLTRSTIREVVAQYDVKDIYSEKRGEASQQILDVLQSKLNPRGIEVEDVLLRNVVLPENLSLSIEAKLQAEQESQRYDFVLEKEKKEAERKRVAAEGQRDAQQIINQSLTTRYLEYLYIESLKDREGTIYVPTNPSNGMPLFRGL